MNEKGFSLFAKPSFWEGMARIVDIVGSLNEYNYSNSTEEADYRAISSDWEWVGWDIRSAMKKFADERQEK